MGGTKTDNKTDLPTSLFSAREYVKDRHTRRARQLWVTLGWHPPKIEVSRGETLSSAYQKNIFFGSENMDTVNGCLKHFLGDGVNGS